MAWRDLDLSARGRVRVVLLTALGTLSCIAMAFAIDSYSFAKGEWRWGQDPINNLVIPLVLAPPILSFLLLKLRELAIAHHELLVVSSTDSLTSCLNRRAFTAVVDGYLERIASQQAVPPHGALLVIDVDHFKKVNDSFGHDRGDEALKLVAEAIRCVVRDIDVVGRLGGEEFSVFLPGMERRRTEVVAERIRAAVNAVEFAPTGDAHPLSVSVGGATFDRKATFSELYHHADQRLYVAKRNGRNRVEVDHVSLQNAARLPALH